MFVRFYQIAIFASVSVDIVFRACGDGDFWKFGVSCSIYSGVPACDLNVSTRTLSHVVSLCGPHTHCSKFSIRDIQYKATPQATNYILLFKVLLNAYIP